MSLRNPLPLLPALILLLAGAQAFAAPADVMVAAATGGGAISADTVGGAYTSLSGPKLTEKNAAGFGLGTLVLNAPAGFEFDQAAPVTVTVSGNRKGTNLTLSNPLAAVTASNITIEVTALSSAQRRSILTYSGIKVRPKAGYPLVSGAITRSGTSAFTASSANYGTLAMVPGAASNLVVVLPDQAFTPGSGLSGTVAPQTAGVAFALSSIVAADQFLNIATNYQGAKSFAYSGPGGSPSYTADVTFSNGQSITPLPTTLLMAETTTITASDGAITGPASSPLIVIAGDAARLQVLMPGEAAAPGTPTGKTGTPAPQTAGVAFPVAVRATDTNWNPVASVTDTVALAATDVNALIPPAATLASGTGTFSVTLFTAGSHTFTATNTSTSSIAPATSAPVTIDPGLFTKLQLLVPGETAAPGTPTGKTGTPAPQTAGTAFTVSVHSVDAQWNVVPAGHFVDLMTGDANALLPNPEALVGGTRALAVTLNTAGNFTITAEDLSDSAISNNTSPSIAVAAGTFAKLQLLVPGEEAAPGSSAGKTGQPLSQSVGNAFTVTVNAVDARWNLVNAATDTVYLTSSDPLAGLPPDGELANGTRSFGVTLNTAGGQTVTASDLTDPGKQASTSAVISVGVATLVPATGGTAISADSTSNAYTSLTGPVIREGSAGNIGAGTIVLTIPAGFVVNTGNTVVVTVTGTGTGSDVALASSTATVSATGITVAINNPSTGTRASTLTWSGIQVRPESGTPLAGGTLLNAGTATLSGIPGGSDFGTLTEVPGAAHRLSLQTQPSATATAGVVFARQPVLRVEDQFGNLRVADQSTVVSAVRAAGAGTLQGTLSAIAVNGVSTFDTLHHYQAGPISLAFGAPGLAGATSDVISVTHAMASQLAFLQPPAGAAAGSALTPPVTVRLQDAYANAVSNAGVAVAIALSSGTGPLSGTATNLTDAGGVATFADLSLTTAGTKTFTATATGMAAAVSGAFLISPAAASQLVFLQPPTNAAAGAVIAPAITVQTRDAYGNIVTNAGIPISLAISSGTGTLGGTATRPTAAGGIATFNDVSIAASGSKSLTASSAGLAAAVSGAFTISAGDYTKVQILVPGETAAPGTLAGKAGTPIPQIAGHSFTATVNAVDDYWNVLPSVTNTVGLYSATDAGATRPPNAALVAGTGSFAFTFSSAGNHTVTAEDLDDDTIADNTSPAILVTTYQIRITNAVGGMRLPFGTTQWTLAGNTLNIVGTLWYTNAWRGGTTTGTLPAAGNWTLPLTLPDWGSYTVTVCGTNSSGHITWDQVTFSRQRSQVFWFAP